MSLDAGPMMSGGSLEPERTTVVQTPPRRVLCVKWSIYSVNYTEKLVCSGLKNVGALCGVVQILQIVLYIW